jgi:CcmD family protein
MIAPVNTMIKNVLALAFSVLLWTVAAMAMQPPAAQSEFVPATPGAATEQLPAAPLLIAAYAFVWIAAMVYLWTIWRRLNQVEDDLHALERKTSTRNRP